MTKTSHASGPIRGLRETNSIKKIDTRSPRKESGPGGEVTPEQAGEVTLILILDVLRELYSLPRDAARFRWYLRQLTGSSTPGEGDIILPIGHVNPMGKEHCLRAVEALIALDAEAVAREAIGAAAELDAYLRADARLAINLIDDLEGGWTNRYLVEAGLRFSSAGGERANREGRFVIVPCWTSETYTRDLVRQETLAALYRLAWRDTHGLPTTLDALLHQEGNALRFAGVEPLRGAPDILAPHLTPDELSHASSVIDTHRAATDFPTQFAAFFGDEAALSTGHRQLGLPHRAGFAVALAEAARQHESPFEALSTTKVSP